MLTMRPLYSTIMLAVSAGVLAGCSQSRSAVEPTNRQLIAAMPGDMESVLVLQAERLGREDCALRGELQFFFGGSDDGARGCEHGFLLSTGDANLDRVVYCDLLKRSPVKRAVGVGGLQRKPGLGASFQYVAIWVTRESNRVIQERIERRDGIVGEVATTTHDGLAVYSSSVEFRGQPRELFVAFPDEHVTAVACSLEQVTHVAAMLNASGAAVPGRWEAAAAELDLEAPVVLLRKFAEPEQCILKPDPENPKAVRPQYVPIDSFGLTSDAGRRVRFKLRIVSREPEEAQVYFYGGTFHGGFHPAGWTWATQADADGLTARVEFAAEGKAHHSQLILITLLGIAVGA